nr:hypothetical protein [Tanacetum cinerariifolium]
MLWGIIISTNFDYSKFLWEEFVQAIQTFLTNKANLGSPTKKGRKYKPRVISYCRFTKLIICHLGRIHNIHQRSISPFHLAEEDLKLGNLKFVPKGEKDEVFEMPIPNKLISKNISMASYYSAYLEMVAKHNRIITAEKEGKKKPTTAKQPKPKPTNEKSSKPAPVSKPKATKEKLAKPSPAKPSKLRKVLKTRKGKNSKTGADSDKTTSGDDTKILQIDEDQGKDVDNQVNLKEKTVELDQGQTGLDLGKTPEPRPLPEQEFMEEDHAGPDLGVSRMALVGLNPKPTHEEFMANVYPDVHGSLKLPVDEHFILEEPLSSSGTLSSMKNLDDAYTFGDQFLNDKSTEYEPWKLNMDSKVVSMVTVLILQASESKLAARVAALEQKLTAFKQKSKTLDNITQNLGSKIFTLKLQDLPYKIDQTVNTVVKEAQWMFESGSYKSLPEHVVLYEALEASMEWANRDEFLAKKDKVNTASAPQSSAWKTSDTRETPSSSSKEQSACHSEQLIEDVPIIDNVNVSDSKDTDIAHLPKLKTKPD